MSRKIKDRRLSARGGRSCNGGYHFVREYVRGQNHSSPERRTSPAYDQHQSLGTESLQHGVALNCLNRFNMEFVQLFCDLSKRTTWASRPSWTCVTRPLSSAHLEKWLLWTNQNIGSTPSKLLSHNSAWAKIGVFRFSPGASPTKFRVQKNVYKTARLTCGYLRWWQITIFQHHHFGEYDLGTS